MVKINTIKQNRYGRVIPESVMNKGVALKMMYHYKRQPNTVGNTIAMKQKFEKEYSALIQNPHWGVTNVLNFFRSFTKVCVVCVCFMNSLFINIILFSLLGRVISTNTWTSVHCWK